MCSMMCTWLGSNYQSHGRRLKSSKQSIISYECLMTHVVISASLKLMEMAGLVGHCHSQSKCILDTLSITFWKPLDTLIAISDSLSNTHHIADLTLASWHILLAVIAFLVICESFFDLKPSRKLNAAAAKATFTVACIKSVFPTNRKFLHQYPVPSWELRFLVGSILDFQPQSMGSFLTQAKFEACFILRPSSAVSLVKTNPSVLCQLIFQILAKFRGVSRAFTLCLKKNRNYISLNSFLLQQIFVKVVLHTSII